MRSLGVCLLASVCVAVVGCGSDDETSDSSGGTTSTTSTSSTTSGAGGGGGESGTGGGGGEDTQTYAGFVALFHSAGQPKEGVEPRIEPVAATRMIPSSPKRAPDAAQTSTVLPGTPGIGCVAYKFTTTDPTQPGGPGLFDGDAGLVTITGFTGGKIAGTENALASEIKCQPMEVAPGISRYACDLPAVDVTGFLTPGDAITWSAAGGAGVGPFASAAALAPFPTVSANIQVKNDLWGLTPGDLDGTADLTVSYDCDGGPCAPNGTGAIYIHLITTDTAPVADAPYDFPPPTASFGVVECVDLLAGANQSSYTIGKNLLAQIPGDWKALKAEVAMLNMALGSAEDGTSITAGAGFCNFGVSRP
jgi:hypothetical protein